MYDLIIIGGGPAGITAAATALNQRLETLIIAERWGGQTTYAMQLADTEGREVITGEKLLDAFRQQLDYLDFVRQFDTVTMVQPQGPDFMVETARGNRFKGRSLIVATGAKPERLNVPGASRLAGRGLSYSATTHGSLFLGADVAVVGREQRAQCAVVDLARKAHRVYLLTPDSLEETPLVQGLRAAPNVEVLERVQVQEVIGGSFVDAVAFTTADGESREVPVKGVFVKLPRTPNSDLVRGWVDLDESGSVYVDVHCATNVPGVFAAGDVTHVSEQVLIHIGEGAKAAISASRYLLAHCP